MAASSHASACDAGRCFHGVRHRDLHRTVFFPSLWSDLAVLAGQGSLPPDPGITAVELPRLQSLRTITADGFRIFAVGRQRKVDAFKLLLLSVASIVAFRTMRDAWFICIPAAACIADTLADVGEREPGETWAQCLSVAAVVAISLAVFARSTDFNSRGLDRAISSFLPVNAVNYLRQHPAPGPVYNTLDWGGFLTWYMPDRPVAIDGRTDLYGDDLEETLLQHRQWCAVVCQ